MVEVWLDLSCQRFDLIQQMPISFINPTPGIWLSPDSKSPPILTLFGSTNLNARSAHLDTELSFLMVLPTEVGEGGDPSSSKAVISLRRALAEEIANIRRNTVDWQGWRRKVRKTTKGFVWLLKGML
jgi:CDP-diacylglycerol--glycerol-3-phosphate 3-phosphatidyltransferase